MIVTISELQLLTNLTSVTHEERAVLQVLHKEAESKVKNYLGYDPEQAEHTEYYPRYLHAGGAGLSANGVWDISAANTAVLRSRASQTTLQLQHIPVRSITSVSVDYDGKFGQGDDPFATNLTAGTEYWAEYEQDNVCMSGILYRSSGWPIEPGTVKVTYRAGYSPTELNGGATASDTDNDGTITTQGVDAASLKRAVTLTVTKAIHTWDSFRKDSQGNFRPGQFQRERLQDYEYELPGNVAAGVSGMLVQLPAEAIDAMENFRHWGIMRL